MPHTFKLCVNRLRDNLTTLLVALSFLFNSLCMLANILFPKVRDFGELLVVIILMTGFFSLFLGRARIRIGLLAICGSILGLMLISYIYYGFASEILQLMINFMVWGIGITTILMQRFDRRKVIEISFWISTVTILAELYTNAQDKYESMVWTYAVFPCIAAVVVHYRYFRFSGWGRKMAYLPGLTILFKFMVNANRGGLVSLVMLFFLVLIKDGSKVETRLNNKQLRSAVLLIAIMIGIVFYEPIVLLVHRVLTSANIEISAVSKMYRLIIEGNVTNNRTELYAYAWTGFLHSPLWGNGVGGFSVNHGGWTHNFVLQLLYEGGLLLFLLIIIPLTKIIYHFLRGNRLMPDVYSLFVLFFATSIPRLLFSTELWNTQGFWMLFAFGMNELGSLHIRTNGDVKKHEYFIRRGAL